MAQKTAETKSRRAEKENAHNGSITAVKTPVIVPPVDIASLPEHERWLFENPEALAAVQRGLEDLAAGRVHRMSFAEYADIVIDD